MIRGDSSSLVAGEFAVARSELATTPSLVADNIINKTNKRY